MAEPQFAGDLAVVPEDVVSSNASLVQASAAVLARVQRLRREGFRLSPLPGLTGRVDGLYAVRYGTGLIDSAVIRAFDCVSAARVVDRFVVPCWGDEQPPVIWADVGDLRVLDQLLSLPRPLDPRRTARHRLSAQ